MQKKLYRSRNGVVFGVCRGIGEYFNLSVSGIRLILLFLLFLNLIFGFFGVFPIIGGYVIMAFLMRPEPAVSPNSENEEEFYHSYTASKSLSLNRLKDKFDNLDSRIRRMENHVTNRSYDWERRLHSD